jgi:phosphatidylserine synthase
MEKLHFLNACLITLLAPVVGAIAIWRNRKGRGANLALWIAFAVVQVAVLIQVYAGISLLSGLRRAQPLHFTFGYLSVAALVIAGWLYPRWKDHNALFIAGVNLVVFLFSIVAFAVAFGLFR